MAPVALQASATTPAIAVARPAVMAPVTAAAPQVAQLSIGLGAFDGKQPPGYRLGSVPKGWVVQGSNASSLTIARADAKDKDPNSFTDKLVVLSESEGASVDRSGRAQSVDGRPGFVKKLGKPDNMLVLVYQSRSGQWLTMQAPTALGWGGPEVAVFAAGVEVLPTARPGQG